LSPRAGAEFIGDSVDAQTQPEQQQRVPIQIDHLGQNAVCFLDPIGEPDSPHHLLDLGTGSLPLSHSDDDTTLIACRASFARSVAITVHYAGPSYARHGLDGQLCWNPDLASTPGRRRSSGP
jgi:hypothetical protein